MMTNVLISAKSGSALSIKLTNIFSFSVLIALAKIMIRLLSLKFLTIFNIFPR